MTNFNGAAHPEYVTYKYPKVGEENAKVSVGIYNLSTKKTSFALTDPSIEYIPRIEWTNTSDQLSFLTLNRHQNHLTWFLMESVSGKLSTLLEEK